MMFWDLFLFIFFHSNIRAFFVCLFVHQSDWEFFEQVKYVFLLKIYTKYANLFSFALF
jgi:hypothetical protein